MLETIQGIQRLLNAKGQPLIYPAPLVLVGATASVASSTTFVNIPGLSILLGKGTFLLQGALFGTAGASGGAKFALQTPDTLTASTIACAVKNFNGTTTNANTTVSALGSAGGAATAVYTDVTIDGTITVSAAGTLNFQVAQNASNATATTVIAGSFVQVTRIA